LSSVEGVHVHDSPRGASAPCTYLFVTFECRASADWLLAESSTAGLGITRLYAYTLDRYPHLAGLVADAPFPCAANLAARTVTLTTAPYMTAEDEARSVRLIAKAALRGRSSVADSGGRS
jgi:dTDP-4-amino-4,6-dideoxygalactose transaminase